jgi:hypothetical protein
MDMMAEQYSRPATLDDLKHFIQSLDEHQVEYLLIGGKVFVASRMIGRRFSVKEFGFLIIPIIHGLPWCFAVEGGLG